MGEVTSYRAGIPAWVDLITTDPDGAPSFYGTLFGWEFEFGPEEYGRYTMCLLRGHAVAGMGGEPAPEGMPTAWTTYMSIDDIDGAAQRITLGGGNIMIEPMDVMAEGRMLLATDPTGAVFGLWQAGSRIGAELVDEPGAIVWNELATRDLPTAQHFYTAVLGYEWEEAPTGGGGPPYRTFAVDGQLAGGAMQMTADWPQDIPPHWMPYFAVADIEDRVAQAERAGGEVQVGPKDSPYGRLAVLRDPQGGVFSIIEQVRPSPE